MKKALTMVLLIVAGMHFTPASTLNADMTLKDPGPEEFSTYWYPRGAEISRFVLRQSRYGEVHEGDAVFIYVTEPMNPQLQVKADLPDEKNVPVLKLNATRKFFTGIYPYSIMTSVFSPVDTQQSALPLKISFSSQEWCGHVYLQMNRSRNGYMIQGHSYFEKEADQKLYLENAVPEDAIWTLMRTAPSQLPQGSFNIIPGTVYVRFMHRPMESLKAIGKLSAVSGASLEGRALVQYELTLPDENRVLRIQFEEEFPYRIQQWEDTYSGRGGKVLTTRATRTHTIMSDYWNRHNNADRKMLKKLGLDANSQG